jgi:hypothetical protein
MGVGRGDRDGVPGMAGIYRIEAPLSLVTPCQTHDARDMTVAHAPRVGMFTFGTGQRTVRGGAVLHTGVIELSAPAAQGAGPTSPLGLAVCHSPRPVLFPVPAEEQ